LKRAAYSILLVLSAFHYTQADPFPILAHREEVRHAIDHLLMKEKTFIPRALDKSSLYLPMINEVFDREGLPDELAWLPLIESGFSVHARSRTGATGLWQFMPVTARHYNIRMNFWVDERLDPYTATEKAARHLKDLYRYYQDWELALAAYNAGMGAVNRAIRLGNTRDYWELCEKKLLRRETRDYVPRFYAAVAIAKDPDIYGIDIGGASKYPAFELLECAKPVDLTVLANKSGIKLSELRFLNPELRRLITPIGETYLLRVPQRAFTRVLDVYRSLPENEIRGLEWHVVKPGETLGGIAERYSTTVGMLVQINGITNTRRLYAGKKILTPVGAGGASPDKSAFVPKKGFTTQEIEYTIRKGDTVWDIARRFRTDVETILSLNSLSFESIITPGDILILWIDIAFQR
jgi:membrane-bound lytic murein transglycosylase D